uniref:Uncharacterized protein n=1 Tax=Rhizophora mucronata TaxID=61149 RepID=A0A2P2PEL2_RHIMU
MCKLVRNRSVGLISCTNCCQRHLWPLITGDFALRLFCRFPL